MKDFDSSLLWKTVKTFTEDMKQSQPVMGHMATVVKGHLTVGFPIIKSTWVTLEFGFWLKIWYFKFY